jgi:hypothetical protein
MHLHPANTQFYRYLNMKKHIMKVHQNKTLKQEVNLTIEKLILRNNIMARQQIS